MAVKLDEVHLFSRICAVVRIASFFHEDRSDTRVHRDHEREVTKVRAYDFNNADIDGSEFVKKFKG